MALTVTATNPDDPLRNIRVYYPGFEHTAARFPFHPLYLKDLEWFETIRFMDWSHANSNDESVWADRPRRTQDYAALRKGVPLEDQILLANQLGANPWFTIPHNATDDYVRQFARTVRDTLRPDVTVYVERRWASFVLLLLLLLLLLLCLGVCCVCCVCCVCWGGVGCFPRSASPLCFLSFPPFPQQRSVEPSVCRVRPLLGASPGVGLGRRRRHRPHRRGAVPFAAVCGSVCRFPN